MSRAAFAILSTENLLHNLAIIKKRAPGSSIIAMIKANGYGHGLRSTALRLENQVQSFGVASIDEALALRRVGIKIPITLMEGVFEPSELLIAACENFHVVFHEQMQLNWLKAQASLLPLKLTAWIKIDTGMGRLGFMLDEAADAYKFLMNHGQVNQPVGIMSHFACADEPDHQLNQQQHDLFSRFVADKEGPKSFCNSAAIFTRTADHYQVVRPGISLYGVSPLPAVNGVDLGLRPVMTLQTRLMAVRRVQQGSTIGYGASFTCLEPMPIGVIALGYGDGYPRTARDGTPVLINGVRCPLIGRISMDMMTVDLRNFPTAKVNDPVVLWGDGLPLEEIALCTQQSPYDIVTAVQSRVKFHWTLSV